MPVHHPWTKRYLSRNIWIIVFAVGAPLVVCAAVLTYALIYGQWAYAKWLGLTGLCGFVGFAQFFWILPVRTKLRTHHGKICGNCLFVLEGLADTGDCPECGHHYDINETVLHWQQDMSIKLIPGKTPGASSQRLEEKSRV